MRGSVVCKGRGIGDGRGEYSPPFPFKLKVIASFLFLFQCLFKETKRLVCLWLSYSWFSSKTCLNVFFQSSSEIGICNFERNILWEWEVHRVTNKKYLIKNHWWRQLESMFTPLANVSTLPIQVFVNSNNI